MSTLPKDDEVIWPATVLQWARRKHPHPGDGGWEIREIGHPHNDQSAPLTSWGPIGTGPDPLDAFEWGARVPGPEEAPATPPSNLPWVALSELREGAVFVTREGVRAVKSEYLYDNRNPQPLCVLIASGEYAHFPGGDAELVQEIDTEALERDLVATRANVATLVEQLGEAERRIGALRAGIAPLFGGDPEKCGHLTDAQMVEFAKEESDAAHAHGAAQPVVEPRDETPKWLVGDGRGYFETVDTFPDLTPPGGWANLDAWLKWEQRTLSAFGYAPHPSGTEGPLREALLSVRKHLADVWSGRESGDAAMCVRLIDAALAASPPDGAAPERAARHIEADRLESAAKYCSQSGRWSDAWLAAADFLRRVEASTDATRTADGMPEAEPTCGATLAAARRGQARSRHLRAGADGMPGEPESTRALLVETLSLCIGVWDVAPIYSERQVSEWPLLRKRIEAALAPPPTVPGEPAEEPEFDDVPAKRFYTPTCPACEKPRRAYGVAFDQDPRGYDGFCEPRCAGFISPFKPTKQQAAVNLAQYHREVEEVARAFEASAAPPTVPGEPAVVHGNAPRCQKCGTANYVIRRRCRNCNDDLVQHPDPGIDAEVRWDAEDGLRAEEAARRAAPPTVPGEPGLAMVRDWLRMMIDPEHEVQMEAEVQWLARQLGVAPGEHTPTPTELSVKELEGRIRDEHDAGMDIAMALGDAEAQIAALRAALGEALDEHSADMQRARATVHRSYGVKTRAALATPPTPPLTPERALLDEAAVRADERRRTEQDIAAWLEEFPERDPGDAALLSTLAHGVAASDYPRRSEGAGPE